MSNIYLDFSNYKNRLQLESEEHLEESAVSLTNNQKLSLYKKSQKSGYSTDVLEEVYRRGHMIWKAELFEGTREQFAFDRVNSFISGGFAAELDSDLLDESESALSKKAKTSGVSLGTLRKVYNRGMAAWRTGHRPGTTPQQWGMARVNSYISKGKGTYHGADKDLREGKLPEVPKDKETGLPKKYTTGKKGTDKARAAHFAKGRGKHWDDPSAYEPAPGDKTAKTKESKYTKKYRKMFEVAKEYSNKKLMERNNGWEVDPRAVGTYGNYNNDGLDKLPLEKLLKLQGSTVNQNSLQKEIDRRQSIANPTLRNSQIASGSSNLTIPARPAIDMPPKPDIEGSKFLAKQQSIYKENPTLTPGKLASGNVLKMGSSGNEVIKLQNKLRAAGFDVGAAGADGKFGPKTAAALKAFQQKQGIQADSVYGRQTERAFLQSDKLSALKANSPQMSTPQDVMRPKVASGQVSYGSNMPITSTSGMADATKKLSTLINRNPPTTKQGLLVTPSSTLMAHYEPEDNMTNQLIEASEKISKNKNDSSSRFIGTDSLTDIYAGDTPGQETALNKIKRVVSEATYKGKTVPLNKPMKGDVKKSKVYVDPDGDGKAQKVNFGDKNMTIKKHIKSNKDSYCARSKPLGNDPTKANYWSRKAWDC